MAESESECLLHEFYKNGYQTACAYVMDHREDCNGGGYIPWTELEVCSDGNPHHQWAILLASAVFFVYLFLILSTTADKFFTENIASIVTIHSIPQNIAGTTLLAFGNGSPDIFGSIASVISVNQPQAGLAISCLLGAGIFVTTIVVAAIVLVAPFTCMRRPFLRDIFFYLGALGLLIAIIFYDTQIHLWQPISFLILYLVYVATVFVSNRMRRKMQVEKRKNMYGSAVLAEPKKTAVSNKIVPTDINKHICRISVGLNNAEATVGGVEHKIVSPTSTVPLDQHQHNCMRPRSLTKSSTRSSHHQNDEFPIKTEGKFFTEEGNENDGENDAEAVERSAPDETSTVVPVVVPGGAATSYMTFETAPTDTPSSSLSVVAPSPVSSENPLISLDERQCCSYWISDLLSQLNPFDQKEMAEASWYNYAHQIVIVPCLVLLNLTVPLSSRIWCKPLTMIHVFLSPMAFCFAFQILRLPIFKGIELWHFTLLISAILCLILMLSTSVESEPKYYRILSSYSGFIMSVAWIYTAASEIINVILMYGSLFGISTQILGLTVFAWCNSIGDLVADFAVAKQGFPRMAFSATIGGPLFNLLVGFGISFTIVKLQGKTVPLHLTSETLVMLVFLTISLLSTLLLLCLQRFRPGRIHGIYLIGLYIAFLVVAFLATQQNVFFFLR